MTRLDKILDSTRAAVAPLSELERKASLHQPRGWASALRRRSLSEPAIAEIKLGKVHIAIRNRQPTITVGP